MASLKKLKEQIENANALGVANMTQKGVELSPATTTYEIMQNIAKLGKAPEEPETMIKADSYASHLVIVNASGVVRIILREITADSSVALMEG